jgi:hypothetical protein
MGESEKYEYGVSIGALFETFGQEATEDLIRAYWIGLNDMSLEMVQFAVMRAIRECDRLPRPVELRRLAGEATDEQAATIAWDDVLRAIPCGPYKHVDFGNRTINAVVRNLGGWPNFVGRFTDAESEKWLRQEFIRAYRNLSSSSLSDEACAALAGLAQVANYGNGKQAPRINLIQCQSKQTKIGSQSLGQAILKRIDG